MDRKEAILRIKDHMEHHGIGKYPHLKLKEALDMAIAALDTPNAEKPPCYLPEKDNPYPLCEGRGMKACAHCCLWEDYAPGEDESRVNQPLTMWQLREMDGEPAWWDDGYGSCWGIISVDSAGMWGGIPFFRGRWREVNFEYNIEERKMKIYRRPPEGEEDK